MLPKSGNVIMKWVCQWPNLRGFWQPQPFRYHYLSKYHWDRFSILLLALVQLWISPTQTELSTPSVPTATPQGLHCCAGSPEQSLWVNHSSHPSSHPSSAHPHGSSRIPPCPASCSLRCGADTATGWSFSWCSCQVGSSVTCKKGNGK